MTRYDISIIYTSISISVGSDEARSYINIPDLRHTMLCYVALTIIHHSPHGSFLNTGLLPHNNTRKATRSNASKLS